MTPETLTPRTDAQPWINRYPEYHEGATRWVAADFARQLERENQTFRAAQKACEDCDAPRVDRIAELERELAAKDAHADEIYKAAVNLAAKLEDDLAACREWSSKIADVADELRADLAAERELADKLGTWVRALYRDKIVPTFCEESVHRAINTWEEARK
jgi:hypothetical protein